MKAKSNSKLHLIILLILFVTGKYATAQDSLVKDLREVTITATRTDKNILDLGRSVTVITAEEIRNSNYNSLADILSQESGFYLPGNGQTPGSNQSVFLQGANSNQTAIFIDGIRISDVSTVNNVIDLSEISLHDIERIEILRGSHSTLFGSSSIGGVINISTNKPSKQGFSSNGGFSTGTFGTGTSILNPYADIAYRFRKGLYVSGSGDFSSVSGLDATIDTVIDPSVFDQRDKDNWKKINSTFTVGYVNPKTKLDITYRYTKSETDIDKSAFVDDDNYVLNFDRNIISTLMRHELTESTRISLSAGISGTTRHAVNDSSINSFDQSYDHQYTEDKYSGLNTNIDLVLNHKFRSIELMGGLARTSESMEAENYIYSATFAPFIFESHTYMKNPDPGTHTNSMYVQTDINGDLLSSKTSKFNLIAGLRYDLHSIFKEQLSFELNPSWKPGRNSLIYFSYSTGYNSPSLYQLYANSIYTPWDGSTGLGLSLGNKFLKPEQSKSTELGFKYKPNSKLFMSVSFFHRKTSNNIEYVYLWNKDTPTELLASDYNRDDYRGDHYINAGNAEVYGAEFNLNYKFLPDFRLVLNLSYAQSELEYSNSKNNEALMREAQVQLYNNGHFLSSENFVQKGLIRRPNTAKAEFIYSGIKKLQSGLVIRYIDDRDDVFYDTQIKPQGALSTVSVDQYILLDVNISYQLSTRVFISSRAENIMNSKYAEIRGFSTRGRAVYFKIAYNL